MNGVVLLREDGLRWRSVSQGNYAKKKRNCANIPAKFSNYLQSLCTAQCGVESAAAPI